MPEGTVPRLPKEIRAVLVRRHTAECGLCDMPTIKAARPCGAAAQQKPRAKLSRGVAGGKSDDSQNGMAETVLSAKNSEVHSEPILLSSSRQYECEHYAGSARSLEGSATGKHG